MNTESGVQAELNLQLKSNKAERTCTYCGVQAPLVWVHGHGQCANCNINVEECCRGEQCRDRGRGPVK